MASAVMKEWRRLQIVSASAAVVAVPERVSQASAAALSTLWGEAQELANESLNVAQAAWDAERAEAEKLRVKLSEVEAGAAAGAAAAETARQVAALTDSAHTATARVQEIEKRAEDLSRALDLAHGTEQRLALELEAERKTLASCARR